MAGLVTGEPTLALVGSGPIASAHLEAARWAGFRVAAVAGRPGSRRARSFAARHGIPDVWSDPAELASSGHWDAMILAVEPAVTLHLLLPAAAHGKPVLVEKPVALASRELAPLVSGWPHVVVGFNRRYYPSVRAAKDFLERKGPSLIQVQIPESVPSEAGAAAEQEHNVRSNSVHGFDLLRYLAGHLTVESVASLGRPDQYLGRVATLRSARGDLCSVVANWNSPANFSIDINSDLERFELRPFEIGHRFEGMDVLEPTPEVPIRRYVPVCVDTVHLEESTSHLKPGFACQATVLRELVKGVPPGTESARISDAYEALLLAESLLDGGGPTPN